MTTRDATRLLPRAHADETLVTSISDWAYILFFGSFTWPWLLRSLSGGRKADKRALLDALKLPADALPNLGSWKADTRLLGLIVDTIAANRPANVVELGSGASTLVAARALQMHGGGRLTSYDQHADFVAATARWLDEFGLNADMRAAELGPPPAGWPGHWYQLIDLPERIDLLTIDGPQWTIHPFVRGAAESLFDRIPIGGVILLDDAARPGERIVARRWARRWPGFTFRLDRAGTKGTLIGVRRR